MNTIKDITENINTKEYIKSGSCSICRCKEYLYTSERIYDIPVCSECYDLFLMIRMYLSIKKDINDLTKEDKDKVEKIKTIILNNPNYKSRSKEQYNSKEYNYEVNYVRSLFN
jgi:hypothetical protein